MKQPSRLLTLDANVLIAALKADEPHSEKCAQILSKVPNQFQLAEPSIIYQEVCGTLARKTSLDIANDAKKQMDLMINPKLLTNCDKNLCISAFCLCSEYNIYTIDALYLQVALKNQAILVSLDKEDFTDRIKKKKLSIEVYSVSEFPY
jgi:predicted nucleic acid-binding protein